MTNLPRKNFFRRIVSYSLIFSLIYVAADAPMYAQSQTRKISGQGRKAAASKIRSNAKLRKTIQNNEEIVGVPTVGEMGVQRTTDEITEFQRSAPPSSRPPLVPEREAERPAKKPQDPNAKPLSRTPDDGANEKTDAETPIRFAPQTVTTNFLGATLADTNAFPADTMGAVGRTQFVVFLNGRLRTFNKTTGVADGVLNVGADTFFAPVMTPVSGAGINFTSDPNVRYDRLTSRWFLTIIDVPSSSGASIGDIPNRILIAVSDAASNGVISGTTVWTFYFVQQDTVGGVPSTDEFLDYPSLGVDANALYVGGNMFGAATPGLRGCSVFVIRKSSILSGGPVVTTAFRGVVTTGDGPFSPRGVDNYDPAATEGYFIGVSNAAFGRLIMRRIGTPGGTPTISGDILITTASTSFPITVDHLGDTGGTNGNLDALDDRLYAAHIRNGRLWTAHNIAVLPSGVSSGTNAQRRNAVRWYELVVPPTTGTPTINQFGTVFDTAATVALARQYWIPSVTVSGQGHAALGFSTAGTPFRIDAATNGRLVGDALGTLGAVTNYTASSTAYNPPADPGPGRRWGDYSFTSLDPLDDMTMWTIQNYNDATNSYGIRAAKLQAPPPADLPAVTNLASSFLNYPLTINGTSVAGSGFYDPGTNLASPATPFNHITATVSGVGVTVNSVTYVNPTQVVVNLNTLGATVGDYTLTITNPDGQTRAGILRIDTTTAATATVGGRVQTAAGNGIRNVRVTMTDLNGNVRSTLSTSQGYFNFEDVQVGTDYVFRVESRRHNFAQPTQFRSISSATSDIIFTASN